MVAFFYECIVGVTFTVTFYCEGNRKGCPYRFPLLRGR